MSKKAKSVQDIDCGWKAYASTLKRGDGHSVEVGILDPEIATYMTYNEFGTSTIPARPALRSAYDAKFDTAFKAMVDVFKGEKPSASKAKGAFAKVIKLAYKQSIKTWSSPPNAPSTVARKGFNNPLIETRAAFKAVKIRRFKDKT